MITTEENKLISSIGGDWVSLMELNIIFRSCVSVFIFYKSRIYVNSKTINRVFEDS